MLRCSTPRPLSEQCRSLQAQPDYFLRFALSSPQREARIDISENILQPLRTADRRASAMRKDFDAVVCWCHQATLAALPTLGRSSPQEVRKGKRTELDLPEHSQRGQIYLAVAVICKDARNSDLSYSSNLQVHEHAVGISIR
jgi:hypothetical protein